MAEQEIGAISIGITANVKALETTLAEAQRKAKEFSVPTKDINFRIRLRQPTDAEVRRAQESINRALTKAQTLGVELTPTLKIQNAKIADFRKQIQTQMAAQPPLDLKATVTLEDPQGIHDKLQASVGTLDVPVTWHYVDGPPPSGTTGGGPGPGGGGKGGGGTGGGTGGGGAPKAPPAGGPTGGTTGGKTTGGTAGGTTGGGGQVVQCHLCDYTGPLSSINQHFNDVHANPAQKAAYEEHKKQTEKAKTGGGKTAGAGKAAASKPEEPSAGGPSAAPKAEAAAPPKAPPVTPAAAAAAGPAVDPSAIAGAKLNNVLTKAKPKTEAELRKERFGQIYAQLSRGRATGITGLIQAGGVIDLTSPELGFRAKRGSELGKFLKENPESETLYRDALQAYKRILDEGPPIGGRQAFTGGARSLGSNDLSDIVTLPGGRRFTRKSGTAQVAMKEAIQQMAAERQAEYGKREDVQAVRKAFRERGFDALSEATLPAARGQKQGVTNPVGALLGEAKRLLDINPVESRARTVEALSMIWSTVPGLAKRLFPADPGKGRRSGAGPGRGKPRGTASGTDEVAPGLEAFAAGVSALLSEQYTRGLPRRDATAKAERKYEAGVRKGKRKHLVDGKLVEVDEETPKPPSAVPVERQYSTMPGATDVLDLIRGGKDPAVAAREVVKRLTGITRPKKANVEGLLGSIDPARIEAAIAARSAGATPAQAAPAAATAGSPFNLKMVGGGKAPASHFPTGLSDIDEARRLQRADVQKELGALWASRRATGGPVEGPLQRRIRLAREAKEKAYLVGEKRPELYESTSGRREIVGENGPEIRTFPEAGNIRPNVPEWIRRGMAKDLTGRAGGGPVRGFGGKSFRSYVPGEKEAIAKGVLTAATAPNVQRVFVVNWPSVGAAASQSNPAAAQAAGPFTANAQSQAQFQAQILQAIKAGMAGAGGGGRGTGGTGGGGGGGTGGGGKSGGGRGGSIGGNLTPLEQAMQEAKVQDLITAERLKQKEIAAKISASLREAPTRGVPTATGEVTAINLGGLRNIIERRRLADEAAVRSSAAMNQWTKAVDKLEKSKLKATKLTDPKDIKEATEAIAGQQEAVDFLHDRYQRLNKESGELAKNVISGSDKLRVFGANTAGVVGGMVIFSTLLAAANTGIELIGRGLQPVIERMTGYQNVTAETTNALAEQTRQQGGNVKAVVASRQAMLGLAAANAQEMSALLERRAATEAGNKAIVEQIDLFHTYEQLQKQNQGPFDKGLTQPTGGLFGSPFNAIPSTSELLRDQLLGLPSGRARQNPPQGIAVAREAGESVKGYTSRVREARGANDAVENFNEQLQTGVQRMDMFNKQAAKGGEQFVKLNFATAEQAQKSAALANTFDKQLGAVLVQQQLQFEGAKTPDDILRYLQAQNTAAQMPTASLLVEQAKSRTIPNQVAAFNAEAQYQLQTAIPAQQALSFLQQPPTPYGAGYVQVPEGTNGAQPIGPAPNLAGFGPKAPGVDPTAAASFKQYEAIATSALDAVTQAANEGRQALSEMGVPSGLVAELEQLGNAASGLELGIANRNAAYEAAAYNRQLYLANRQLADAKALLGQNVGSMGRLGALQREQFELSKQQNKLQLESQMLSLDLQQRQINFQRAIAGFTAPGLTPEERQARIDQAKKEADYAQRQLDIQKKLTGLGQKQFTVGVDIFNESARRQVEEARMAISDITQAHQLKLDNAGALQAIDAIRQREAQVTQQIGVAIEKATKVASAQIGQALEIANASGEAFATILGQTAQAWSTFLSQGASAINSLQPGGGSKEPKPTWGGGRASGYFGTVSSPTQMLVGEAGSETIAILRNPRASMATPSGGDGGTNIVIDVHDNALKDDADIDKLVTKISRAVEEALNRKTALIGLRTAF